MQTRFVYFDTEQQAQDYNTWASSNMPDEWKPGTWGYAWQERGGKWVCPYLGAPAWNTASLGRVPISPSTREGWLQTLSGWYAPAIQDADFPIPQVGSIYNTVQWPDPEE